MQHTPVPLHHPKTRLPPRTTERPRGEYSPPYTLCLIPMRHRRLLFLILLALPYLLAAQHWQTDWSRSGMLDPARWRNDLGSFRIADGLLHYSSSVPVRGKYASLMTRLTLPESPLWRGQVHPPREVTTAYSALLLLATEQVIDHERTQYLALDFGSDGTHRLSLRRIAVTEVQESGFVKTSIQRIGPPLLRDETHSLDAVYDLDYQLYYDTTEGWVLLLEYSTGAKRTSVRLTKESPAPHLVTSSGYGFLCYRHSAPSDDWSFGTQQILPREGADLPLPDPSIDPNEPSDEPEEPNDEPEGPDPNTPDEPTDEENAEALALLSELCPYPEKDQPEYIELFNPYKRAIELSQFKLAIGKDNSHYRRKRLPRHQLQPQSYIVLCPEPDKLLAKYPQLPHSSVLQLKFPALRNQQGLVALIVQDTLIIDLARYDNAALRVRKSTPRGVAWCRPERPMSDESELWFSAASCTPGSENDRRPWSPAEAEEGASLDQLAQLRSELSSGAGLTQHWQVYSLLGRPLITSRGREDRSWVKTFASHPQQALRQLLPHYRGIILLCIQLQRGEDSQLSQVYKVVL